MSTLLKILSDVWEGLKLFLAHMSGREYERQKQKEQTDAVIKKGKAARDAANAVPADKLRDDDGFRRD